MIGTQKEERATFIKRIIATLQEPKEQNTFLLSALAAYGIFTLLYGFWKIPLINLGINRLSEVTLTDHLFVLAATILTALFITLHKYEKRQAVRTESTVGTAGGTLAGVTAAICPACQSIGLVALGSTLINIPLGPLIPYLGIFQLLSVGLLALAVILKAENINSCKACTTKKSPVKKTEQIGEAPIKHSAWAQALLDNNLALAMISMLTVLLFVNQLLLPQAFASPAASGAAVSLGNFEYGPKITLKPMPLATGEQPRISGYKSIVKPLPTISELTTKPATGDAVQDLLSNLIPAGTPWYGEQAGVTFDDPIMSQNKWASYRNIQLSPEEQERWNRIANSFTCDYCCGSPQNPTIITRCGCAHAAAAQGMAKWFIKNYGPSYSDEEIYGEMARWYALWYPKGTIERIIQEAQLA